MSKKAQTVFVVLSVLLMIGVLAYAVYKDSILGIGRPPIDGKNEVTVNYNLHVDSVTRLNYRCNVLLFDNGYCISSVPSLLNNISSID